MNDAQAVQLLDRFKDKLPASFNASIIACIDEYPHVFIAFSVPGTHEIDNKIIVFGNEFRLWDVSGSRVLAGIAGFVDRKFDNFAIVALNKEETTTSELRPYVNKLKDTLAEVAKKFLGYK
jgi:hypothetical protein